METTRVLLGMIIAFLLPHTFPVVRGNLKFCLALTLSYVLWCVAPIFLSWKSPLIIGLALSWSFGLWWVFGRHAQQTISLRATLAKERNRRRIAIGLAAIATLLTVALIEDSRGVRRVLAAFDDHDGALIIISALLAAIFISHFPVTYIAIHFGMHRPSDEINYFDVENAGIFIGWFERALIFVFIMSGQAEAAALALTAKSLARHREFAEDARFSEYFLIGTFTSVLISIFWAVAARLTLGLGPM